ncbi:MAG: DUF2889 domain-containing protein [Gammaproteobacteria bacterium]
MTLSASSQLPEGFRDLNPAFGSGALRRRIGLIAEPGVVRAGVEDSYHSFRLHLAHDQGVVSSVQTHALRYPLDTCPLASRPLQRFFGMPLSTPWSDLMSRENPREHCTHLYDLLFLAMVHAGRGGQRAYDIVVPDENPGPVWSTVHRDGVEVLRWKTQSGVLLEPQGLSGRPLLKGFSRWAGEQLSGDELEAALVLHKGYFVSRARRFDIAGGAGQRVAHLEIMRGACFSYSEPRMSVAVRMAGHVIDTSSPTTPLLNDLV